MKHSRATALPRCILMAAVLIAILLPALLAFVWGQHFATDVYTLLRLARHIAVGAGMALEAVGAFPSPNLYSPLFAIFVSVPIRLGMEPAQAALIMSTAGWSLSGLIILTIGQTLGLSRGAVITTVLLSFNPAIITALGDPTSWQIALGWLILALLLRRHFIAAIAALLCFTALLLPWPLTNEWLHLTHYAASIGWSVFLFGCGVGVDWLAGDLVKRDPDRLEYPQLAFFLLTAVFVLVGMWQGIRLWQMFQEKPAQTWQLEEEVAGWLHSEMAADDTVLASEKIGYLLQRTTASVPELPQLEATTAVLEMLKQQPLDYVITTNELSWQQIQNMNWFRLAYEPVKRFDSPNLPKTPYTVWAYRQPVSELGPRRTINARVPDRLWIIGYQIGPQQAQAGESVQMVLYIESPEATYADPTFFQVIIRLISPIDYSTVREWTVDLPQTIIPDNWGAKEVIVEQFPLQLPEDLQAGAYLLNLSMLGPESDELWPLSLDNDLNRLDRIPTSYIIVPAEEKFENVQPLQAQFDGGIRLSGFTMSEAESGHELNVTLVWEADEPPDDDYVVFVHLLNGSGQLAANHDGIPGNGRFPTLSWQPGIAIPDTHTIALPPDLAAGDYILKAGLYDPDSGERLGAAAEDGTIPEDSAIFLTTISRP